MENFISIEEGFPKINRPVEVVCDDGKKYEVYWSHTPSNGSWKDVETDFSYMINVEKWRYL